MWLDSDCAHTGVSQWPDNTVHRPVGSSTGNVRDEKNAALAGGLAPQFAILRVPPPLSLYGGRALRRFSAVV